MAAVEDTITATQGDTTLGLREGATIAPRIAMDMMLRPRRRGMVVVRRRLDTDLRRKWDMHRRGGIEGRHGWVDQIC